MPGFQRYTYFVDRSEHERLREWFAAEGLRMYPAPDVPCRVLDPSRPVSFAAPESWNFGFCRRRGSWYRESPRSGQILIGNAFPIDRLPGGTVITDSDFSPPRLPSREEQKKLIESEKYRSGKPDEWERVSRREIIDMFRGFKSMGTREVARLMKQMKPRGLTGMAKAAFLFRRIFLTNCANHANFMDPRYSVETEGEIIPYSISDNTLYICSACAEMFNLVGNEYRVKMVVPCVGAALYGFLEVNRYYRVEQLERSGK